MHSDHTCKITRFVQFHSDDHGGTINTSPQLWMLIFMDCFGEFIDTEMDKTWIGWDDWIWMDSLPSKWYQEKIKTWGRQFELWICKEIQTQPSKNRAFSYVFPDGLKNVWCLMSTTPNWMWLHLTTTSFPAGWHEKTYIYILQHKSTPSLQTVHLSEISIVYSHIVMGNLFQELRDFHNFPLTEFLPTFVTLPELTSENRHLAKKIPIENPSFLGAKMLVLGGCKP